MPDPMPGPRGLVIAAPASGSGKTVFTLGLLRALRRRACAVTSFKAGPDYIDPAFHAAATGAPCRNLDPWAMRPGTLARLIARAGGSELAILEGAMGLFDGAQDGSGSTADLAALTGWPVVLVADVRGQAGSAAALLRGFMTHRSDIEVAGAVLNRVGSERHAAMLRRAIEPLGLPILGLLPQDKRLGLPERHLGLVQASEHGALETFLDEAAGLIEASIDLPALAALAKPARLGAAGAAPDTMLPPLGQRIAVARDDAFRFAYPALLEQWREAGAAIDFFSPLADEAPSGEADAVFLPGGYPELHAGRLAANARLRRGLGEAAARGATIYGECGGYMLLGERLVDAAGLSHRMAGLLPVETSFATRRRHLGYRALRLSGDGPLGRAGARFRGHEFHYATILQEGEGEPLFAAADAEGRALGATGRRRGKVFGSFLHLIDRRDAGEA
ncbi:MAG: cobyrinate a,c-diamide synthase [Dongiaceae bacterium]